MSLYQRCLLLQSFHSIGCSKSTHFLRTAHVSVGPPALIPARLFGPRTAATSPQKWLRPAVVSLDPLGCLSSLSPPRVSISLSVSLSLFLSLTTRPLAGAAPHTHRKSSCARTFCPCMTCAHTIVPELACTPACMCTPDMARRHASITAVHSWKSNRGLPTQAVSGSVGFVGVGMAEGTRRQEMEALQVARAFVEFSMERHTWDRTASDSFLSQVRRWRC